MERTARFEPEFVEAIPNELAPGKLYISIRYRTASHLCACGCGRKVVTPIKPPRWRFAYNGETVSLWPSIGRWQLPCRAHYCIRENEVVWARTFSDEEMESVRRRDASDLRRYYEDRGGSAQASPAISDPAAANPEERSFRRSIMRLFRRR